MYLGYPVIRFYFNMTLNIIETIKTFHKPISAALIGGGSCLMLEHLFTYNGFDLLDIQGHETYGLILIAVGFILSIKWKQWDALNLKDIRNWRR